MKYGKNGHITKMLPGALVNQSLYESNPFEYMMKEVIPRINPTGKLSDDQVVSKLNALFSGRKGGDLFVGMYMQRANILKQLAAAEKFQSLDQAYASTLKTTQGSERDFAGQRDTLYLTLGQQLLPVYVAALRKLTSVIQSAIEWAKKHPKLAKALAVVGAAFGVLAVVAGGAMIALGGLIGQVALLRFVAGKAGLSFGGRAARAAMPAATAVARAGVLPPALPKVGLLARVGGMLGGEGGMLARAGMLATTAVSAPVLAIAAAIAAAALLVWKYWKPISAFFSGLGQGLMEALGPVGDMLADAFAPLKPAWETLKSFFADLFSQSDVGAEWMGFWKEIGHVVGYVLGTIIRGHIAILVTAIKGLVWAFVEAGKFIGYAMFRIMDFVTKVCDNIKLIFGGWWDMIAGIFTLNGARILKGWHEVWSGIAGLVNTIIDSIKTTFSDAFDWILGRFDWLMQKWREFKGVFNKSETHPGVQWITGADGDPKPPARLNIAAQAPLRAGGGNVTHTTHVGGITVVQQPGEDSAAFARRVQAIITNNERTKAAKDRSAYADSE